LSSSLNTILLRIHLALSDLLELSQIAVKDIGVATIGVAVAVLPESLKWPSAGDGTRRGVVVRKDERRLAGEGCRVSSAVLPPVCSGIDQWVDANGRVVGIDKISNPSDHGRRREAVAGITAGIVLNIEHTGQGDAITGPSTTMCQEIRCLSCSR